ncbi:hypothetical protein FB451DRAFT_137030 [Mycena latifolia]|nr:hypothetical protein FB451DRAFT_137030 [Mycena latifolia]
MSSLISTFVSFALSSKRSGPVLVKALVAGTQMAYALFSTVSRSPTGTQAASRTSELVVTPTKILLANKDTHFAPLLVIGYVAFVCGLSWGILRCKSASNASIDDESSDPGSGNSSDASGDMGIARPIGDSGDRIGSGEPPPPSPPPDVVSDSGRHRKCWKWYFILILILLCIFGLMYWRTALRTATWSTFFYARAVDAFILLCVTLLILAELHYMFLFLSTAVSVCRNMSWSVLAALVPPAVYAWYFQRPVATSLLAHFSTFLLLPFDLVPWPTELASCFTMGWRVAVPILMTACLLTRRAFRGWIIHPNMTKIVVAPMILALAHFLDCYG